MNKTFISILVVTFIIASLMIFQATRSSASHVLRTVELEKMSATGAALTRIRVGARVTNLPIDYTTKPNLKLEFSVTDPALGGSPIPVIYEGLKPDMFAAGRDVIIDGKFENGTLYASQLLTQCPSKYEPPQPGKGAK